MNLVSASFNLYIFNNKYSGVATALRIFSHLFYWSLLLKAIQQNWRCSELQYCAFSLLQMCTARAIPQGSLMEEPQ